MTPSLKPIKKLDLPIHFGERLATVTDLHNELIPYFDKINELVDRLTALEASKEKCPHCGSVNLSCNDCGKGVLAKPASPQPAKEDSGDWECQRCGAIHPKTSYACLNCGEPKRKPVSPLPEPSEMEEIRKGLENIASRFFSAEYPICVDSEEAIDAILKFLTENYLISKRK